MSAEKRERKVELMSDIVGTKERHIYIYYIIIIYTHI